MNKTEIEKVIYNEIISNKQNAEHQADIRYYKALQNKEFENIDKKIRSAIIEKARIEFEGKSSKQIDDKIRKLKEKREIILKSMNMSLAELKPKYKCNICLDTGFVNNARCSCFQNAITKALFENSNLNQKNIKTFKDFKTDIYDDKDFGDKLLKLGENIVSSNGNFKVPIIVIRGNVGAGKTYFLECLSNELINKNIAVVYMPAFELSQKLLEWHLGSFEEKNVLQQLFIDCDVLVIDDLGTEPIYQNVSVEYLQNIIDIRTLKNKLTVISTNLDANSFLDRYGDRLNSRIYMSDNALKIELKNRDLRKK